MLGKDYLIGYVLLCTYKCALPTLEKQPEKVDKAVSGLLDLSPISPDQSLELTRAQRHQISVAKKLNLDIAQQEKNAEINNDKVKNNQPKTDSENRFIEQYDNSQVKNNQSQPKTDSEGRFIEYDSLEAKKQEDDKSKLENVPLCNLAASVNFNNKSVDRNDKISSQDDTSHENKPKIVGEKRPTKDNEDDSIEKNNEENNSNVNNSSPPKTFTEIKSLDHMTTNLDNNSANVLEASTAFNTPPVTPLSLAGREKTPSPLTSPLQRSYSEIIEPHTPTSPTVSLSSL